MLSAVPLRLIGSAGSDSTCGQLTSRIVAPLRSVVGPRRRAELRLGRFPENRSPGFAGRRCRKACRRRCGGYHTSGHARSGGCARRPENHDHGWQTWWRSGATRSRQAGLFVACDSGSGLLNFSHNGWGCREACVKRPCGVLLLPFSNTLSLALSGTSINMVPECLARFGGRRIASVASRYVDCTDYRQALCQE